MKQVPSILCLFLLSTILIAQEPAAVRKTGLPDLDSQVRARLAALDARLNPVHSAGLAATFAADLTTPWSPFHAFTPLLADRRNNDVWEQLPDDYYRMMIESGDALVTMQESTPLGVAWTSEQVRRLCQERLASLPRASLEQYRQRVDAEAKALLELGRNKRSLVPLRRVADELFASRHGDEALDLLGDLCFERGHFDEARYWWSLVAPIDGLTRGRFMNSQIDVAKTEAKQVLATLFAGRLEDARTQLDRFRQRHPRASADFAGRKGVYHETLSKMLTTFQNERIRNNDEPWTTFGGGPARNRVLTQGLASTLWEDGVSWRVKLPSLLPPGKSAVARRGDLVRGVAFHPIIVNDQVLVADHRSVVSYHLKSGAEAFRYDLKTADLRDPGPGVDLKVHMPRFTLSADHGRAFVRLGSLRTGLGKGNQRSEPSYLVCLDLSESADPKKRELWHVQASSKNGLTWFEGSPLAFDGRVFAVQCKVVERRIVSSIVCFDELGRQRWSRAVCDVPEPTEEDAAFARQHLLTLAGGQIVYATHSSAIVAVDSRTGEPTWAVRYPSRGPLMRELVPSPRDLAPCLHAEGRVYAAPLDSDRLFCIDVRTGSVFWEVADVEIVHLLGVVQERIFATTPAGLQAFRTDTGRIEWLQPSDGRLSSSGRGLIAGGWLFWPTQDQKLPYRAVTLREGAQSKGVGATSVLPEPSFFDPTMLANLPAGNWAFGQGCLAIAGVEELVVYTPPRFMPQGPIERPQARLDANLRGHAADKMPAGD